MSCSGFWHLRRRAMSGSNGWEGNRSLARRSTAKAPRVRTESSSLLSQRLTFLMPEAGCQMIVHETGRLHMRIHNRAADESETALLQILADGIGLGARRGHLLVQSNVVLNGLAADEAPQVIRERSLLL